jgi:circadian clock protein KaiC
VAEPLLQTGVPGLDDVLRGGFPRNRVYLIQGDPGVGKTTLSLQILREGVARGERGLYVNLSETTEELAAVAASHGWTLDGIDVAPMSGSLADAESAFAENTLYATSDVELAECTAELLAKVEEVKPQRLIIDSCSELRLLAQTPLRFRRLLLSLKQNLRERGCTVFLIENPLQPGGDRLLQSLVHGVLVMEQRSPEYGADRRRLRIAKLREVGFRGGHHDVKVERGGLVVCPRLVAAEHGAGFERENVSSGIPEIDRMLGGGIDRGSGTLLIGPAGSGKSALASQYAVAIAERGHRAAMFTFEESLGTLFARAAGLGIRLEPHVAAGRVTVQQVDPAELSPGEFATAVRAAVEEQDARMIVIDSLNGYLQSMTDESFLVAQLHELLSYLRHRGVLLLMVVAQHGFLGPMNAPVDISYLADNIILFRFYEHAGRVCKSIAVVKKRAGPHEDTIRAFALDRGGFRVGAPLTNMRGVLTGVPTVEGTGAPLTRDGGK